MRKDGAQGRGSVAGSGTWYAIIEKMVKDRLRIPLLLLLIPCGVLLAQTDGGALSRPTGLEASDGAYSDKVGLSWDHIRNATTYQVFRGTTNDPALATSVGSTASVIFYDFTAEREQRYFYWVQAENGNLRSALSAPDDGFRALGRNSFGRIPPLGPPPEPAGNPLTGAKVYLGKTLFWDEQLSSTRTVACGTCHISRNGGSDPRSAAGSPRSKHPGVDGVFGTGDDVTGSPGVPLSGADGAYQWSERFGFREQVTRRKAQPTVDAAYFDLLLWDGRADRRFTDPASGAVVLEEGGGLESQALKPLVDTTEMGHQGADLANVVARVTASKPLALAPSVPAALAAWTGDRGYPELFAEAFGTPQITAVRIALAMASYERTLYSDRTPFDAAVSSITDFSPAERRGRQLFTDALCDFCHKTTLFSDKLFRYIGVRPDDEDGGRFEITGRPGDMGRFKTPGLRNVALRAPYMHDGRFGSLEEVVEFYNRGGDFEGPNKDIFFVKPLQLSEEQKSDLIAFMKMLTDPRAEAESGPLFDRPMLYAESARVPQIVGEGRAGSGGIIPQVQAIEPPLAGNPSFTVGLFGALGGAEAVLVIDNADPGADPQIPESASFARRTVTLAGEGAGQGYASLSLAIPTDPGLIGTTLFGRWFVADPGAAGGVAVTPAFRLTVFGTAGPSSSSLSSVSAASLAAGFVAPESIVSGFGEGLATATETAGALPLPTFLGGVSVLVRDSAGSERLAPLFYASPRQINYQIPPGMAAGEATVAVLRAGATVASGKAQVRAVAPSLFTANSDGRGIAAALALRVRPDGSQSDEPVARFDAAQNRFVAAPIDLGPEGDRVYLVLFGTGIRFRGSGAGAEESGVLGVSASVGGVAAEVLYAGPQPEYIGVDQVNLRAPRSLAGRGEVDVVVEVDGERCNTVRLSLR